jgi:hypothetical protein
MDQIQQTISPGRLYCTACAVLLRDLYLETDSTDISRESIPGCLDANKGLQFPAADLKTCGDPVCGEAKLANMLTSLLGSLDTDKLDCNITIASLSGPSILRSIMRKLTHPEHVHLQIFNNSHQKEHFIADAWIT